MATIYWKSNEDFYYIRLHTQVLLCYRSWPNQSFCIAFVLWATQLNEQKCLMNGKLMAAHFISTADLEVEIENSALQLVTITFSITFSISNHQIILDFGKCLLLKNNELVYVYVCFVQARASAGGQSFWDQEPGPRPAKSSNIGGNLQKISFLLQHIFDL